MAWMSHSNVTADFNALILAAVEWKASESVNHTRRNFVQDLAVIELYIPRPRPLSASWQCQP